MTFESKLNETNQYLSNQIKEVISQVGAVDTGRMRDITFVNVMVDDNGISIDIDTTNYYRFVDRGTVNMEPRKITEKLIQEPEVIGMLGELLKLYWLQPGTENMEGNLKL